MPEGVIEEVREEARRLSERCKVIFEGIESVDGKHVANLTVICDDPHLTFDELEGFVNGLSHLINVDTVEISTAEDKMIIRFETNPLEDLSLILGLPEI